MGGNAALLVALDALSLIPLSRDQDTTSNLNTQVLERGIFCNMGVRVAVSPHAWRLALACLDLSMDLGFSA